MKKILFVCLGNTCRSPMAEFIYNSMDKTGLAMSKGLMAADGKSMSENAIEILYEDYGIPKETSMGFCSGKLLYEDLFDNDIVIAMDNIVYSCLEETMTMIGKNQIDKLYKISEEGIEDPFGKDIGVYRETAKKIKEAIEKLPID